MTETEQLDIVIRSIAEGSGFSSSAAQAKAMNAEMAALGGGFSTHGATITTAEKDISKEADSMARALGSAGEQGGKALARFESLGATLGSTGALGIGIGAALVAFGAVYEGTKGAIENADKLEHSTRSLTQAYDSQGQSLANQGAWIAKFLDTNRRYIDDQYAAREAIASVVRAGYDQAQVQRISNDALDLAVAHGVSYTEAVRSLNLALQGNTRGLRDLGLSAKEVSAIMGEATKDSKELAGANKTLATDTERLTKAQEALNVENDRLHAKHTVTAADLDILHEKQKAVSDLTSKVTADQNALADAEGNVATTAGMQNEILGKVEGRTRGLRDSTTDLKQAQNDLNRSWQDASERYGPALAKALANGIDIANSAGQIIGNVAQHPENASKIVPAALGVSIAPSGRDLRTQENLLGNPEIDRRNIDALSAATQRAAEWQDRLGTASMATSIGLQREAEFSDAATINLGKQRDESDNLATKNAVLKQTAYDVAVANSEMSTRITEVIGKWRDDADAAIDSGKQIRDQLGLTKQGITDLAKHARDEKVNVTVTVDYGAVEAANFRINDLAANIAAKRRDGDFSFPVSVGGAGAGVDWNQ